MTQILQEHYLWLQAGHIISFIAWMAGMLYLPRLYVYHAGVKIGGEAAETFKMMERKLLRFIMNPALILTVLFGGLMLTANPLLLKMGWMHGKLTLVLLMLACHGLFAKWRKDFAADNNRRAPKFYKIWNEVPTLLLIGIVILAVIKPL